MVSENKTDLKKEPVRIECTPNNTSTGRMKWIDARNIHLPTLTIISLVGFFVWGTYQTVSLYNQINATDASQDRRLDILEGAHAKTERGYHPHDHPEDQQAARAIEAIQREHRAFKEEHNSEDHHKEFMTESDFKLWCVRMQIKNPEWKCDPNIKSGMTYEDMRELERFWHKNKIRKGDLGG